MLNSYQQANQNDEHFNDQDMDYDITDDQNSQETQLEVNIDIQQQNNNNNPEQFNNQSNENSTEENFYNKKRPKFQSLNNTLQKYNIYVNDSEDIIHYLSRFFSLTLVDFNTALTDMVILLTDPSKFIQMTKWNFQIRHKWGRQDPAFALLIFLQCIGYSIIYSVLFAEQWSEYLYSIYKFAFLNFIVTSILYTLIPKFLVQNVLKRGQEELQISTVYCFDVFMNAFFIFSILNYGSFTILSPILKNDSFTCKLISGIINLFANYRFYYTLFQGYKIIPSLQKTEQFLTPIIIHGIMSVLLLVLGQNYFVLMIKYIF